MVLERIYRNICSLASMYQYVVEILELAFDYPCFSSFNFSTRRLKSIEDGESKSYSFECARAFCSGVSDL